MIELLVVVLIIGILAAVALPQYEKAVVKSRFSEAIINLNSLAQAHQLCYLEKGEACLWDELSIELKGEKKNNGWQDLSRWTKYFYYVVDDNDTYDNPVWAWVMYRPEAVCLCALQNGEIVLSQGSSCSGVESSEVSLDYAKLLNIPDVGEDFCCCT